MKVTTDFLVSKPTSRTWSGVFGYRPENEPDANRLGEMFAVISLSAEVAFDLGSVGGLLLDELQQAYFNRPTEDPELKDLEDALWKVKTRIDTILNREDKLVDTGLDIEMAVVLFRKNVIYLAIVGESKVFISRGNDFAEITGALIDPEMSGFMRTGSLFVEDEDRILLVTKGALETNKEQDFKVASKQTSVKSLHINAGSALLLGYNLSEDSLNSVKAGQSVPEEKDGSEEEKGELIEHMEPETSEGEMALSPGVPPVPSTDDTADLAHEPKDYLEDDENEEEENAGRLKNSLRSAKTRVFTGLTAFRGKIGGRYKSWKEQRSNRQLEPEEEEVEEDEDKGGTQLAGDSLVAKIRAILDQTVAQLSSIWGGFSHWFSLTVLKRGDRRELYLKSREGEDKRWRVLVIVFVVGAVALFFLIRTISADNQRKEAINNLQNSIATLLSEKESLANQATVVSIGEGQELQKQQLAQNIDAFISRASELLENEYITLELEAQVNTELIDAAMQLKDQVLNIEAFTDPQIVADLAVNFEGTTPSDIAYAEGKLYVADSSRGVVYSMGTTIGSEARVFASNFVKPYLLDADEDGDIVVIDEAVDSCISTINTDNAEVLRHVGLSQSKIGKLSAMDIWPYNKTLYSANPAKQAVLKQENVAGNYQIPNDSAPWRSDPDFVNARDIAVDGGIFVLIGGKGLLRYWAGQPDSYEIKGLIESDVTALTNATAFEITDTKAYFALPSVTGGRVLVFDRSVDTKQMTFKYQFVYRGETAGIFSDIKELVANDAAGELFVLDGTKIIRLKLS